MRAGANATTPDSRTAMPDVTISLPDDGTEFEVVTQFAGHAVGGTIDASSGQLKVPIGVPFADKYNAMKVTDRPGETMFFVVFARVNQSFYGGADEDDE